MPLLTLKIMFNNYILKHQQTYFIKQQLFSQFFLIT